jgi:Fe(3+) dicitrate transport protein
MEDGVLIAPAPYAAPAAYYFPTTARMEALEVRKGAASIGQGPYTTGGVINLVSSTIPPDLGAAVKLFYGTEGTLRLRAKAGDSSRRVGWLLETYQLDTEGFKELDGGGSTGVRLGDYLGKMRFNSSSSARTYQLLELKLGKTTQDGQETYLGLTQEDFDRTPLRRYAGSQEDWIDTDHEQIQLRYFAQPTDSFYLTTTVYRNDFFRNWHKLQSVGGVGISSVLADPFSFPDELSVLRGQVDDETGGLEIRNNRRSYRSEGIDVLLDWQIAGANIDHQLQFGLRLHRDSEDRYQEEDSWSMIDGRMRFEGLGRPASQANRIDEADALAIFARDSIYLGRWTLSPGIRLENIHFLRRDFGHDDPDRSGENLVTKANDTNEILPGIGVNYSLGQKWNLFGGLHRGFAPPGPGQDPETRSEESWNYELGARFNKGVSRAKAVAFYSDYSNLLGRDTLSAGGEGTGDAFNGGAVKVVGLEAAFDYDLGAARGWSWSVPLGIVYTYTHGEFLTSFTTEFPDWAPDVIAGDELPYLPEHQLGASGGVSTQRWSGFLNVAYVDAMRTSPGQGPIPRNKGTEKNWVADLSLGYRLRDNLAIRLQARNLLDELYVVARRPAGARPGLPLTVLIGIDWTL